jgi:hypothetical protein
MQCGSIDLVCTYGVLCLCWCLLYAGMMRDGVASKLVAVLTISKILLIYHSFAATMSQLQQCHKSKLVFFHEKPLKVFKCYNFLWVQRRHNCSPVARFANCVIALYMLKVHLQTFLFIQIPKKCQILICDTLVANEWYLGVSSMQVWSRDASTSKRIAVLTMLYIYIYVVHLLVWIINCRRRTVHTSKYESIYVHAQHFELTCTRIKFAIPALQLPVSYSLQHSVYILFLQVCKTVLICRN